MRDGRQATPDKNQKAPQDTERHQDMDLPQTPQFRDRLNTHDGIELQATNATTEAMDLEVSLSEVLKAFEAPNFTVD